MDIRNVYEAVARLADYGIREGLLEKEDRTYTVNRLLEKLKLDEYEEPECIREAGQAKESEGLSEILSVLLDYAAGSGLLEDNTVVYRDLFDTELMNCLLPRPSEVIRRFEELYKDDPKAATDYYYHFSRATDYIRTYRVSKDIRWTSDTPYGEMIITINLSKPEKDPKAIAAALSAKQSSYPKCLLCSENEGYAGRVNHPARANHRIIPIKLCGADWYLQYSPYVYYNEHCIVFNSLHTPMKIDYSAFDRLLDFVSRFPHYCVGSNADLPIVGGSILTHDHFQGGCFEFPMAKAPVEQEVTVHGFENVSAGIVKWPMTVLRLASEDRKCLADCADAVLKAWREYTDEASFIFAYTEEDGKKVPHSTITPIARFRDGRFELDLVLRNNITTKEHPLGVYHPHAEYHHIKKENIGLIEVMGLAILPARLKDELRGVCDALVSGADISKDEVLAKHADWVDMLREKYGAERLSSEAFVDKVIKEEVANVYSSLLEQCAVFGRDKEGREALLKFICSIN